MLDKNIIDIKRSSVIFVLSSPSGAGKTTVSKELVRRIANLHTVASVTTRPKRTKEHAGVDYIFVTNSQFESWIAEDKFLEHDTIFGYYYGTLWDSIKANMEQNYDQLLTLNWQGAKNVKAAMTNRVVTIFMVPPSLEALRQRLLVRHGDDLETVNLRLGFHNVDMQHWQRYDYLVVNDDLQRCVQAVEDIIQAERMSCKRITDLWSH